MKKKLVKLEVPLEKSLFYAISCSDPLHKLAWHINAELSLQLKESDGIHHGNEVYPTQKDETSSPGLSIIIIKNKLDTSILFRELPNIDYIIKLQGNILPKASKGIVGKLKKTPSIIAVIAIDPQKIKNINLIQSV
jgi:hypothetical protein